MMDQNGSIDDIWKTKAEARVSMLPALANLFYSLLRGLFLNSFTLRCSWDAGSVELDPNWKEIVRSQEILAFLPTSLLQWKIMKKHIGFWTCTSILSLQADLIPILSQSWPAHNLRRGPCVDSPQSEAQLGAIRFIEHFMAEFFDSQDPRKVRNLRANHFFFRKMFDFIQSYNFLYVVLSVENIPFLVVSSNRKHVESQRAALPVALRGVWRFCRLDRLCFATGAANQQRSQDWPTQPFFCRVNGFEHPKNMSYSYTP